MRESPNGNSYRSDSPECDSPRDRERDKDRGYKSTYLQKIREKERDRDFKREKYPGNMKENNIKIPDTFGINLSLISTH